MIATHVDSYDLVIACTCPFALKCRVSVLSQVPQGRLQHTGGKHSLLHQHRKRTEHTNHSATEVLDSNILRSSLFTLDYLGTALENSIFIVPCSAEKVTSIILSFPSNGCNVKAIPVYIYKCLVDIVSPVLANLLNVSESGVLFLDALKIARVVPIYKPRSRQDIAYYRPTPNLPVIFRILRKLMRKRLISFMAENNITSNYQVEFYAII